jgi:hypothetical protein
MMAASAPHHESDRVPRSSGNDVTTPGWLTASTGSASPTVSVAVESWWDDSAGDFGMLTGPGTLALPLAAAQSSTSMLRSNRASKTVPGVILPRFIDSHVHLGLIDRAELFAGGIGSVVDLGWEPNAVAGWQAEERANHRLEVVYAGRFVSVAGGYPAHASWAPPGAVAAVGSEHDAVTVVAQAVAAGSSCIKITLNSEVGPVLDDRLLHAVVAAAHNSGLPVVAHVQGAGQAQRAVEFEVDALAHTPWTEILSESAIRAQAASITWISTLDIHGWGSYGTDFHTATRNLSRFAAAGGRVSYGTDLGNGPLPTGLNPRELSALGRAGLTREQIISALVSSPLMGTTAERAIPELLSWIPTPPPTADSELADWLCTVQLISPSRLAEMYR